MRPFLRDSIHHPPFGMIIRGSPTANNHLCFPRFNPNFTVFQNDCERHLKRSTTLSMHTRDSNKPLLLMLSWNGKAKNILYLLIFGSRLKVILTIFLVVKKIEKGKLSLMHVPIKFDFFPNLLVGCLSIHFRSKEDKVANAVTPALV